MTIKHRHLSPLKSRDFLQVTYKSQIYHYIIVEALPVNLMSKCQVASERLIMGFIFSMQLFFFLDEI